MATTVPRAYAALYQALQDGVDCQVSFGPPELYEQHEVVSLAGVRGSEDDVAIGAKRRDENFWITVRIKAWSLDQSAGGAKWVSDRGWELYDQVRAAVHDDRTLGGTVRVAGVTNPTSENGVTGAFEGGWVIFIDCEVDCRARITGGNA